MILFVPVKVSFLPMRQLTKDYLAIWVTLIALASQLFFGVVHVTALWVASAGPVARVEAGTTTYAFLQICTAGGLVSLGDEDGPDGSDQDRCPVCASAATSPMLDAAAPVFAAAAPIHTLFLVAANDQIVARASEQRVFIRGPPDFSQI